MNSKGQLTILFCSRINPLFSESPKRQKVVKSNPRKHRHSYSPTGDSSGYGGSHDESCNNSESSRLREDALSVSEEPSKGALTTIPEGKVDTTIPKPVWPRYGGDTYDSLVDEALLYYTSNKNYGNVNNETVDVSVKDVLIDVSNCITAAMEESNEQLLQPLLVKMKERVAIALEVLRISREEEMRTLCVNLSNSRKVSSVLRACSRSSSGNSSAGTISSDSSPEFNSARLRRSNSDSDETYKVPLGFTGSDPEMMAVEAAKEAKGETKKNLLKASDDKPSVWEYYYGIRFVPEKGKIPYVAKPTDVPLYVSTTLFSLSNGGRCSRWSSATKKLVID